MATSTPLTRDQVKEQLKGPGHPRRVLSCDGGGIRGALSAAVLAKIESDLREHYNCSDLVLADYFDVVGGTSTGSLIATAVALGKSTEEIQTIYNNLGVTVFKPKEYTKANFPQISLPGLPVPLDMPTILGILKTVLWHISAGGLYGGFIRLLAKLIGVTLPSEETLKGWYRMVGDDKAFDETLSRIGRQLYVKYDEQGLQETLKNIIGEDRTFHSGSLCCDLVVVCECVTAHGLTDPTWSTVFFNSFKDSANAASCRNVPIWKACCASAAAPTFFSPTSMVWEDHGFSAWRRGITPKVDFIDGGISGYNNPENALLVALMNPGYNIRFEPGEDKLLLVSVGTGYAPDIYRHEPGMAREWSVLQWARFLIDRLLGSAGVHQSLAASLRCHNIVNLDNPKEWEPPRKFEDPTTALTKRVFASTSETDGGSRLTIASRIRLNVELTESRLASLLGRNVSVEELEGLSKMDTVTENNLKLLREIGDKIGSTYFRLNDIVRFL